ncbi:PcfJ domain-containing protein [Alicyclobacillus fastidiosus]|uniref:PcfJ domain-containing protein n=1 Tax=Alicyclobacillus fastidiosus TaxID=392011 RepID=A0ABV5AL58_9BACL
MGRKTLIDEAYVVYYEKSLVNPEAITARGIYTVRDYRGDYRAVETLFETKAMYLFEPGNCVMYERPWLYYSESLGMWSRDEWRSLKSISSLSNSVMAHKPCFCSYNSIRAAVQGTPFQYSTWEQYKGGDMVKFFDLAAKYPCVEYLTKLGMRGVVEAKLNGGRTYSVVNWRARTPLKVLKMSKHEMNELRTADVSVDPWMLHLRYLAKKEGSNLSIADIARISREIPESYQNYLNVALGWTNLGKLDAYFIKQLANPDTHRLDTKGYLLSTWNDYIKDCIRLGLDISNESVKFPKNLHRAHQNTIKQIKLKVDAELTAKITQRCKSLKRMQFEAHGFVIRPAVSSKELIDEGKALQHCVGTYADRYAKGETDIFVLRRLDEPDKPFYTVEIRAGNIVQCRGLRNCVPTEDVKSFIELFVSKKLLTKKRTRVGIAV